MCGIVGLIHNDQYFEPSVIQEMMKKIHHRGPDNGGYYHDREVSLGFRRLSIIDRTENANQPMFCENKRFLLTFNGEIYNFNSIKDPLIERGHQFQSHTDSEVVLHGYEEYGVEILHKLRGMFAFAIWDKEQEELFLARDPFGIKPLYYSSNTKDGSFLFGSEIKSFLPCPSFVKEFNKEALKPYLTFQYSALVETFFEGVFKLNPGHYMIYKKGSCQVHEYWDTTYTETTLTLEEAVEEIKNFMEDSVRHHQMSEVKVGSFLSGGIDSSYVTTLMKPKKTFSVGFKDYNGIFNETNLAEDLSEQLEIQNHRKLISGEEFFEKVPAIQYHMDEPHANLSSIPLYFLAELASRHVTVVLSGEGADELFGGYDWYQISRKHQAYEKVPFPLRQFVSKICERLPKNQLTNFLLMGGKKVEEKFIGQAKIFSEEGAVSLLKPPYHSGKTASMILKKTYQKVRHTNDFTKMQYTDIHHWLPGDILQKADKMSSAHSLELRVPFLDKQVMETASKLAPSLRVHPKDTKYALRQAAKSVLPEEWADRAKVGFPVPIRDWLRKQRYYEHVKEVLLSETASSFFHTEELLGYLDAHYENQGNWHRCIWTVYVFLIWYEVYFVNDGAPPYDFKIAESEETLAHA
ncbi:asparagine synthase (glutamine-hydrolyzing) [Halobacillus litoralis]|uniref:asparagine synthase (glutamine-hydrolyzing) n=1 Tax=Halobacillus litoralis TaxID=45668 RepID=A0A410MES2_9BACI|nr:asparagine synthase (glutamine-hydrolyzing) [Halobacillus litoralis]QAS53213.1 asparagine synthase (glutamine-hydrolyzing) [Halobacillus litoralis]